MAKNLYNLRDYHDVWGNAKDGYEVNDSCIIEREIYIDPESTKAEIVKFLKTIGYLKKHIRVCDLLIEGDDCMIEIHRKRDYYPVCRLEKEVWLWLENYMNIL